MSVASCDFTWQQGEDLTIQLIYKEGPQDEEVAVNLIGWQLRMDVVDDNGVIFTFNSDDIDSNSTDPVVDQPGPDDNEAVLNSDGSINILIPRTLTLPGGVVANRLLVDNNTFNYDIFLRNPAGQQWPILRGKIVVEKSYTLWR